MRRLACRGTLEGKQAAQTTTRYPGVTTALVSHQQKMAQHLYNRLGEACGYVEQKDRIPSELKGLFKGAKAVCQQRKPEDE